MNKNINPYLQILKIFHSLNSRIYFYIFFNVRIVQSNIEEHQKTKIITFMNNIIMKF